MTVFNLLVSAPERSQTQLLAAALVVDELLEQEDVVAETAPEESPAVPTASEPTEDNNPYGVAVGQVWEACDPRGAGRRVLIVLVSANRATVQNLSTGLRRNVALKSFRPLKTRGFRLVREDGSGS